MYTASLTDIDSSHHIHGLHSGEEVALMQFAHAGDVVIVEDIKYVVLFKQFTSTPKSDKCTIWVRREG